MLDAALAFPVKPWYVSGSLPVAAILVKEVVNVSVSPGLHEGG